MGQYTAIVAQRLKELRLERGLTSAEKLKAAIEEKLGFSISKDSLRGYESPEYSPQKSCNDGMSAEILRKLAEFYGVSADYILGFDVPRTPNHSVREVSQITGIESWILEELAPKDGTQIDVTNRHFYAKMVNLVLEAILANKDALPLFMSAKLEPQEIKYGCPESHLNPYMALDWYCNAFSEIIKNHIRDSIGEEIGVKFSYYGEYTGTPE